MTIAFVSILELLIAALVSLVSLAVPAGVAYLVWNTWKGRQEGAPDRSRGEGVFTEAVVGADGVLRAEVPLGPRWAGRPVRVVVEAIGPL